MQKPTFKIFAISAIIGNLLFWLFIMGALWLNESRSVNMVLVMSIFAFPIALATALLGYPLFKTLILKFGFLNEFINIFISVFLSAVIPMTIGSLIISVMLGGAVDLVSFLTIWGLVLAYGLIITSISSTIYWRWSKNV